MLIIDYWTPILSWVRIGEWFGPNPNRLYYAPIEDEL